jgi:hypothetical protein
VRPTPLSDRCYYINDDDDDKVLDLRRERENVEWDLIMIKLGVWSWLMGILLDGKAKVLGRLEEFEVYTGVD